MGVSFLFIFILIILFYLCVAHVLVDLVCLMSFSVSIKFINSAKEFFGKCLSCLVAQFFTGP